MKSLIYMEWNLKKNPNKHKPFYGKQHYFKDDLC